MKDHQNQSKRLTKVKLKLNCKTTTNLLKMSNALQRAEILILRNRD